MIVAIALMIDSFDFIDILWTEGKRLTWVTEVVMVFGVNGWGCFPLDSFKITALLVTPPAQLWCRDSEVLVSFWWMVLNPYQPPWTGCGYLCLLLHHRNGRPDPSTSPCLVSQQSSSHTSRWPSFQVAHPGTWVSLQQVTFSGMNPRAWFDSINSPLMFPFVQFFRFWWAVLIDPHGFSPIDRGNTCPLVATTKTMIVQNINEFSDYSM